MGLAAGEIQQGRAITLFRHHAQIHLQPTPKADAGFRVALRQHLQHVRVPYKSIRHGSTGTRRHKNVQIADGVPAASITPGHHDAPHAGRLPQIRHQRIGIGHGQGQLYTRLLSGPRSQRVEDVLLSLLPEPLQAAHTPLLGRQLYIRQAAYVEMAGKRLHAFGAKPRNTQQLRQRGWDFFALRLQGSCRAGPDDFLDFSGQIVPDAGEAGKVFAPHDHLRDLAGKIADRSGGKPVRPHTERIRPFDFEQVGHLLKDGCDLGVMHRHDHSATGETLAGHEPGLRVDPFPSPARMVEAHPATRIDGMSHTDAW